MSIQRFKYLYVQFISKRASPDESREFLEMVRNSQYDQELQVFLDQQWATSEPESQFDEEVADKMYNNIISSAKNIKFEKRGRISTLWLRTVAAMLILGFGGILYVRMPTAKMDTYVQQVEKKSVSSDLPPRRFINLPDGSSVIINENSSVELGDKFGTNGKREVYLSGEAYFDIVHDPARPFIVHAGNIETTVLGTAFNINADLTNHRMSVTVIRGKVKVGDMNQVYGVLNPNQQLVLDKDNIKHIKKFVNANAVTAWKNEDLYFDEVTLQDVATELSRRFNVPIVFSNESIKKCRFSATFLKSQTLGQILDVISEFNQIKIQIENNTVSLHGAGCQE